ncbi:PEP-CTERM sorting domain-containing protein [Verrucomicrobiaceae bacterium R5-34]|nr:PEP-CTERM sorting domain-containing protein [Verrucomicrobiaceae bacterium R5-34]
MKIKSLSLVAVVISVFASANAAISIRSTNIVDFDSTTSAIVDNTGNVLASGSGFVGVGTFGDLTDEQIQAFSSASLIDSSFNLLGSTDMNVGDGLWSEPVNEIGDTSAFLGESIFTVIGNGDSIADSDQFFIYRHSTVNGTGTFNQDPNTNGDAVVADGASASGSIVLGGNGDFQFDFGAGSTDAFNLVTLVPEPSSTALLGLGGLALLIRRRR